MVQGLTHLWPQASKSHINSDLNKCTGCSVKAMLKESGAVREAVGPSQMQTPTTFLCHPYTGIILKLTSSCCSSSFWPPEQNNAGSETQNFHINTRQPCSRWESQHGLHSRSEWSREYFGQWWEQERRQLLLTRGIRNVYFVGISSQQHQKHEHKGFIRRYHRIQFPWATAFQDIALLSRYGSF